MPSSTSPGAAAGAAYPPADGRPPRAPDPCPGCEAPLDTPYCPRCGEQDPRDRPRAVRDMAADALEALTSLDGTLVRTLRALVAAPGALTLAYVRGDRRRFLTPLRLFLIVNVAHFVAASLTGHHGLDTPLGVHRNGTPWSALARALVDARLAERGVAYEAYAASFDRVATTLAKSLVILMVPAFALAVAALQRRRRRGGIHHAAFALHVYAVVLLLLAAFTLTVDQALGALLARPGVPYPWERHDAVSSALLVAALAAWIWHGFRRAYGDGRVGATLKTVVAVGVVAVVLQAYRLVLFLAAFGAS